MRHAPCIVEPVAACVADCSVRSIGSYIQYSTSPSLYNKREIGHSKRLSSLLEWQRLQLSNKKDIKKWNAVEYERKLKTQNKLGKHTILLSTQFQSKRGMEEPWKRREGGHSIRRMKPPIERESRSPHEIQKPQSHSQFSSWWERIILCNVVSHLVICSCSIHIQNLEHSK